METSTLAGRALELLERDEAHAAHLLLADAFHKDLNRWELGQIANLIIPCGMLKEAKDALYRLKFQALSEVLPREVPV